MTAAAVISCAKVARQSVTLVTLMLSVSDLSKHQWKQAVLRAWAASLVLPTQTDENFMSYIPMLRHDFDIVPISMKP